MTLHSSRCFQIPQENVAYDLLGYLRGADVALRIEAEPLVIGGEHLREGDLLARANACCQ